MVELRLVEYEWTDGVLGCTKERLEYRWNEDMGDNFWKVTEWQAVPIIKMEELE